MSPEERAALIRYLQSAPSAPQGMSPAEQQLAAIAAEKQRQAALKTVGREVGNVTGVGPAWRAVEAAGAGKFGEAALEAAPLAAAGAVGMGARALGRSGFGRALYEALMGGKKALPTAPPGNLPKRPLKDLYAEGARDAGRFDQEFPFPSRDAPTVPRFEASTPPTAVPALAGEMSMRGIKPSARNPVETRVSPDGYGAPPTAPAAPAFDAYDDVASAATRKRLLERFYGDGPAQGNLRRAANPLALRDAARDAGRNVHPDEVAQRARRSMEALRGSNARPQNMGRALASIRSAGKRRGEDVFLGLGGAMGGLTAAQLANGEAETDLTPEDYMELVNALQIQGM